MHFDRTFQLLSIDDIMTIFLALMSEEKKLIFVSDNTADLVTVIWTCLGLMYPFECVISKIPVLIYDQTKDFANQKQSELQNSPQTIVIGMSGEAFDQIINNIENPDITIIVDMRDAYCKSSDGRRGGFVDIVEETVSAEID
jgi:hypothetical protein